MKKVLILQNKGKSYGGVWQVNRLVGEELIKNGYEVHIVAIRNNQNDIETEHAPRLKIHTINEKDLWSTYRGKDILDELKKGSIFNSFKMILSRIKYEISLKQDITQLHQYIATYNPDYIITSHYQLLDMIPKKYLSITINEQHSSFIDAINHKATRKTLEKYNGKVQFLWLTKKTMEKAEEYGLINNLYIYNAVRFKSSKQADVIKNKKLITITRISEVKRLDLMINICEEIFKDNQFKDWVLEIYGDGELEAEIKNQIHNQRQIKLKGLTNNPQKELLDASINLNTSKYEGFSMSILEAQECGVPTISFDCWESVHEQIISNKTGIIAKDKKEYIDKLKELMLNESMLQKMSNECKQFSNNFQIDVIVKEWIKLFNKIDS